MNSEDIHNELEDKEVREFLARKDQKFSSYPGEVSVIEKRIAELQETLIVAKQGEAIRRLVEMNGWKFWDVSDEIEYRPETYFSFVGTEVEHKDLLSKIKAEVGG